MPCCCSKVPSTIEGDALLSYLERVAIAAGVQKLFALSTKTMHWFIERGFSQVSLASLPRERQAIYDNLRRQRFIVRP